ncbi:MAG: valine--tRNA ligase, partial [Chloroflexi bacterium]|nr:valine--tRNA ligase [Chloroflexota bacterium]
PETILGDTAVAVNPTDPRYADLVGRMAVVPVIGREIPIVGDESVDPAFGTGAVKVTPAHDPTDFEVAQRHNLPSVLVMNLDATMNGNAGPYAGQDRYEARKNIVRDLETEGLLVKIEDYTNNIGTCDRCGAVVEPIISEQWYLNVKPLAERAVAAVADGRITIIPERFNKVYDNWMENIRDWCISRQLWWGHRIPVWYCADCRGQTCTLTDPTQCAHCGSARIEQDPDVLDTWFSSGLWPHSTLGWPDDTEDLRYFYPTSVLETGYDILFFWVARMIMMGLENMDDVPFRTVYLHGLIRDDKGEKMSKTKGNVVDPLVVVEEFGTDALRWTLSTGSSPGNDMRLTNERLTGSRNFANKLWNAGRFVLTNLEAAGAGPVATQAPPADQLPAEDRWILSRLNRTALAVNRLLGDSQFGEANRTLYEFLWNEYCDWYIELAKVRLRNPALPSALPVLAHVLDQSLRLLHPVMPFITEEIWQSLRPYLTDAPAALIIAPYPLGDGDGIDLVAEGELDLIMDLVRSVRNARTEHNVEVARRISAVAFGGPRALAALGRHAEGVKLLARIETLELLPESAARPDQAVHIVLDGAEAYLPLAGLVDLEAERKRLTRDLDKDRQEIGRLETKLADPNFAGKAPAAVIAKEQGRLDDARQRADRLAARLATLT